MEREWKFRLTPSEYLRLKKHATKAKRKTQLNAYFDDSRFTLKNNGAGLRVRIENGKAFLTLKKDRASTRSQAKTGLHSRHEWECSLPVSTARKLVSRRIRIASVKSPIHRKLEALFPGVVDTLVRFGTIRTERLKADFQGFHGELDKWKARSKTRYELEIETRTPSRTLPQVRKVLNSLGIPLRPHASTKLAALFQG